MRRRLYERVKAEGVGFIRLTGSKGIGLDERDWQGVGIGLGGRDWQGVWIWLDERDWQGV